jgi:hypothetical protein
MVIDVLASPVRASASVMGGADPVTPRHVAAPSLVIVGSVAAESVRAPGSPSPSVSLPSVVASNGLVEQTPLIIDQLSGSSLTSPKPTSPSVNRHLFEDEFHAPPKVEGERLSREVLLHIAYEVVSQQDMAEEFRLFSQREPS